MGVSTSCCSDEKKFVYSDIVQRSSSLEQSFVFPDDGVCKDVFSDKRMFHRIGIQNQNTLAVSIEE